MRREFEFKNFAHIIQDCDALILNDRLIAPVIEEKILDNGKKVLMLFWGGYSNPQCKYLYDDAEITFDGQTFEIKDKDGEWTLIPLLKLKKWEDY